MMNKMSPLDYFLFLAVLAFIPLRVSSTSFEFDFPELNPRNLTLLGDSHLKDGVVGLTRDSAVPTSSSGTVIYNSPVQFFDPDSNTTASFSTTFSFSIVNINPGSSGDGLAFFLSPDNETLGSPGGFLGLVNSSQLTKNRFVAVEFDTRLDEHFDDPSDNHVGLDIESLISVKTANLGSYGVDLKSGKSINAWIDYKNDDMKLMVFVSKSGSKPETPVLKVNVDLSGYLKEFMYLGFSGSTEGSTEAHKIESWSFQTFGFSPLRPRLRPPHNVSDSAVIVIPQVPKIRAKADKKRVGLGVGIAVPAFCCALMVIFGWVSIKKWNGIKQQRSFKAENVPGPREFTYKELKLATKGFHSGQIIGRGAFGTVYKAIFVSSGCISAIKRSKQHTIEGKSDFLAELSIIACLRHKNLVQLQGWCTEKDELLLVYEFMPNGSLDRLGTASDKTDVFSYGVVVLELACGRRPIERETDGQRMVNLVDFVWGLYGEGKIVEAADERLKGEFVKEEIEMLLMVGLSCAHPDFNERPNMRRVLQILNNESEPLAVPRTKPTLVFSCSIPLSLEEIVSEDDEVGKDGNVKAESSSQDQFEINIDGLS
ncbi:hypothetical protein V2J09_018319 [Rumex salicifolius]